MKNFKPLLIIVGTVYGGKTRTLLAKALDNHKISGPDAITVFVSSESDPATMVRNFFVAPQDVPDNFHFVVPEYAEPRIKEFEGRKVFLFVDCTTETKINLDHGFMAVSFMPTFGADMNKIADMTHFMGVTVNNGVQNSNL